MMELATWQEDAVVLLLASNQLAQKQCMSTVLHIYTESMRGSCLWCTASKEYDENHSLNFPFLSNFPKHQLKLEKHIPSRKLVSMCKTHCIARIDAIEVYFDIFLAVIQTLDICK